MIDNNKCDNLQECQWSAIVNGAIPGSILATLGMLALRRINPAVPKNVVPIGFASGYFGGYISAYYSCFSQKATDFVHDKVQQPAGNSPYQVSIVTVPKFEVSYS